MTEATGSPAPLLYRHHHLLGIAGLSRPEITGLLDLSESYVEQNRSADKKSSLLRGRTIINLFFESSTRTRTSFELAGKRLGGDVINMSVQASSIKKGETLIDTAMTLNAMHPDVLVVRHPDSGAVSLLSQKVDCAVINGGDGSAAASAGSRGCWSPSAATSCTAGWRARTSTCSQPWARGSGSSPPRLCCPPPSAAWAAKSSPTCARASRAATSS